MTQPTDHDFSKRNFWGWGLTENILSPDDLPGLKDTIIRRLGIPEKRLSYRPPPQLREIRLPPRRSWKAPPHLRRFLTSDTHERVGHCYGKSFRDVVRGLDKRFNCAPDLVAIPSDEAELADVLSWCQNEQLAVIPYGGGSSVVGGVESQLPSGYTGSVSLDMRRFSRVLEIDAASRSARIQGGIYGPALEEQLRPHGLTMRHYPQSFEFSTLGGWIATRSGGHYATRYTHIDEFVQSVRLVAPSGVIQTRRLPGSGAGSDPNRFLIGTEGTAGVICEAWMRLQHRPDSRASSVISFTEEQAALEACRALSQSGLEPSNLRLINATEAANTGMNDGSAHCLLLGFEGKQRQLMPLLQEGLAICSAHSGTFPAPAPGRARKADTADRQKGSAEVWRSAFIHAPYGRDLLACYGLIVETFETAVTWDQFPALHKAIGQALAQAGAQHCEALEWSWRFTHMYPDGPAPYYTVTALGKAGGDRLEQWDSIKRAVSEVLMNSGATITHHHAVGRDHQPWHSGHERPALLRQSARAALKVLDPAAIMNPGALW